MASHLRLIRPAGTLAAKGHSTQLLFSSSNLRLSVTNGCTVTHQGPDKAFSLLAKRAFSTSLASNSNQSSSGSKDAAAAEKTKATAVSASEVAEEETKKKVVAEAEKKRIEAQDAALKEILESAAAEKRKLEQEAIKVAEEKARLKAAQEVEAAAAKARTAAAAKAKAEAEADAAAKAKLVAERQAAASAGKSSQPQKQQEHKQEQYQASWSHSQATGSSDAASNPMTASSNKSSATDMRVGAGMSASSASSQQGPSTTTNGQAKDAGFQSPLSEDPLEPFKAKLLPYKRSLESSTEYIRSALPDSLRQLSESMKRKDYHDTIALLAGHLNTFTGYNAINELKHKVITHGDRLDEARIKLVQAKQAYEDAIGMRSDTQKAINDLLQRKHLWSPDDVIRFTDLYRSEHANEQAEQKTKAQYKQAESEVEDRSRQLTTVITERYHEEQVWSDKIRAASTYGTWGLIGVNVMAFLVVQAFVEPRRRRKQVERYEELVQDLTERGILPNPLVSASTGAGMVVAAPAVTAQPSAGDDGSEAEDTDATAVVAVGGALLGGEDVLLKIIQSAERQEERLDRMESLLLKQIPDAQVNANADKAGSAGNFVVADDGSILFMPEDDDGENNGSEAVGMAKAWREEIQLGSRSGGLSELDTLQPGGSRLSRVLKDGGAEVPATRRDFLLSGLGGAIIGGLVTVVVMMNC